MRLFASLKLAVVYEISSSSRVSLRPIKPSWHRTHKYPWLRAQVLAVGDAAAGAAAVGIAVGTTKHVLGVVSDMCVIE